MALKAGQVRRGAVAYFDTTTLNEHPRIETAGSPAPNGELRPFLCMDPEAARNVWLELTMKPGDDRIAIGPTDKGGANQGGHWLAGDSWVNDASSFYVGPSEAFVEASEREFMDGRRPFVKGAAVKRIRAELRERSPEHWGA